MQYQFILLINFFSSLKIRQAEVNPQRRVGLWRFRRPPPHWWRLPLFRVVPDLALPQNRLRLFMFTATVVFGVYAYLRLEGPNFVFLPNLMR